MKDTFIQSPNSVKESKERNAFIKEFVWDNSVISIDNNKYLLKEVYLTYSIDSKKVYKQVSSLIFKTIDLKTKEFDCPEDYTKFKIVIDEIQYDLGDVSRNLACEIPVCTNYFKLIYYDNGVKRSINFKEN
ncbi:hypothetical protein LNQ49_16945 [Flavobacterium sp. F-65]|uniref:Uncharacterized protein n=1 Tax=Flavobacterium pisciphilum TaxID=2893755 RepID=A0ABS8MWV7_9FLAO|nr:hypothetical protein [Flavobacterium sp. F-65]MCC9073267.1 hypothetical protein [Flavobacterium sp. F-65]